MDNTCQDVDCPICMDIIEENKNCVTTECGHKFHTNCLMKSVAHNGFGCPYCRTAMAEENNDDEDEEEEEDEDYEDENENDEDGQYDDYALRGLRFLNNNLNGEEHDPEDIEDEEADNVQTIPSPSFIHQKLVEQGITMEDLVKVLLVEHEDYTDGNGDLRHFLRVDRDVYEKMRCIILNYEPQQASQVN
jgi:hypothetical protein